MPKGSMEKRLMFKVCYFEGAAPFICRDLKELVDELTEIMRERINSESEDDVRIETVMMSPVELAGLPEFEGP